MEILGSFAPTDVLNLDLLLDEAAKRLEVGLILWPLLRTTEDVVAMLATLQTSARWRCEPIPWGDHEKPGATLVGLTWRTAAGDSSSVMGFAPHGAMPVTRVAPYVAVAVWPGGHENPNPKHSSPAGHVGFVDCKMPELSDKPEHTYENLWKQTLAAVRALLESPPPDDRKRLHDVAFCLPSSSLAGFRWST
jgi:hypothetical protein